jgi:RHS repeat-associated protein
VTASYQDGPEVVLEKQGSVTTFYLHGPGIDALLAKRTGSTWTYYHQDGLGSIAALTNTSGTVVQSYAYEPFGSIRKQTGTLANAWEFTGRPRDAETSLLFLRNRSYDPRTGTFITQDPIGVAGGVNVYAYSGNNPTTLIDPWGLEGARPDGGEFYAVVGIGGTIGGSVAPFIVPSIFVGSAANIGMTSSGKLLGQVQASALGGWGIYGGVGAQLTVGYSPNPIPRGLSVATSGQFQGNVGAGASLGGSIDLGPDGISLSGGVGRVGGGLGLMVGGGASTTSTHQCSRSWTDVTNERIKKVVERLSTGSLASCLLSSQTLWSARMCIWLNTRTCRYPNASRSKLNGLCERTANH